MAIKRSFILSSGLGLSADNIFVVSNTNSASSTTGSVVLSGGIGIGQSASISGRLQMFYGANYTAFVSSASGNTVYTLPATSPATGSSVLQSTSAGVMSWVPMTATGGGGAGTVYDGSLNSIPYYPTAGTAITGSLSFTNTGTSINIGYTTAATNSSSGALTIVGGVGIGGTLFVGTTISVNSGTSGLLLQKLVGGNYGAIYSSGITPSATNYTMITDGAVVNFNGTSGVYFNISNTNKIQVTTNNINIVPTAASISTSTGAFTVAGGVGVGGSLYVTSATGISGVTINAGVITGNLTGTATTAGFATTSSYSLQSGYAITSGTATTAQNINVNNSVANSAHPLLFSPAATGTGIAASSNTSISFNASTLVLSTSGLAVTAGTASTSSSTGALVVTGGVGIGGSLFVNGDLTINGTTTTINSVTLTVDDKNIELGSVNSPSDVTAEAGGITLKGATDKLINWYTGTGWSSSESWNLATGNTYKISNTTVLSNSSLGTGVTNSSLTALGTITTGVWAGTAITAQYGGTGLQPTFIVGDLLYANTSTTWARLAANSNSGYILASAGTGATPVYTNPSTITVGTAITSTNINAVSASTNASHPLLFTPTFGSVTGLAVSSNTTLVYNPSTDILSVSGMAVTSTTASTASTSGALTVTGGIGIGQSASVGGRLQMFNGANYTAFVSSATGNTVYTLPATSPATGSSVLQSTSAGVMSWVPMVASSSGATSANVNIVAAGSSNLTHSILFTPSSSSSGSAISSDSTISFNPSTEIMSVSGLAITSGTASTNTTTGALIVRGGLGVTGQLSFATASFGFTGITTNPSMSFIGATTSSPITLTVLTDNSLNWEGSQGSVFSIDSNLSSGEIFAVSDISGLPIISASAGQTVNINEFGGYTQIGNGSINSSSTSTGSLVIAGGLGFTGNAFIGGTTTITNLTSSSSTSSGSLVLNGGLGISGNAFIGGTTTVTNLTSSSSVSSGSLVLNGGLGISGNAFIGGTTTITNLTSSSSVSSGSLVIRGGLGISGNAFIGGTTTITNLTSSSSVSSGSLVLNGGLGISGNAFIGGTTNITNTTNSTSTTSGALTVNGGIGITGNAFIGGTTSITNTTASTSNASGALVVSGGVGIGQSLFVGGNISNANYFYSGGNNFVKSGQAQGDIFLDNNTNDTPGLLYYYRNNTNFGIDVFAVGIGATRFRIVRDLNESTGAEIWSIDRTGVVTRSAWDVGEVINTRVYNNSDLGMSATTTINSTTYTNVAVITYTPKSSTSHLWIEFDANYDYSNGTTTDDFFSRITVAGSVISERNQIMVGQVGGGTRSGVIFPISGRYTNSSTSGIAITVQARWGSADDAIRVYGSSTSGYMRIQEIGR